MDRDKSITKTEIDHDSPLNRPASITAGALPMDVEGPMKDPRYRLSIGMTDEDRQLRHQWLKDQMLAENEPVVIPGMYEATNNPIKRFMNYPMNTLMMKASPHIGSHNAYYWRMMGKGFFFATLFTWATAYYLQYQVTGWEMGRTGWRLYTNKPLRLPGQEGHSESQRKPKQFFADFGFSKSDPAVTGITTDYKTW